MKLKVEKTHEAMSPTVTSAFFGDMSIRRTAMERRVTEIMTSVNAVIKSIINLLYDLKEFDIRLQIYDDYHEDKSGAEEELKRIWMDEVDVRKGTGSIHNLTTQQQYQFVTLRDAFYTAKGVKQVEDMDLNKRVKNILKSRLKEYEKWVKESERELRQRRKIELTYLKSQVNSLKLYTQWARPYLKAIKRLGFKDIETSMPDIVSSFNQTWIEISLRAKKDLYMLEVLKEKKFSKEEREKGKAGLKMCGVVEIIFKYRTMPLSVEKVGQQTGYGATGKVEVDFKSYAFTEDEYEKLLKEEEKEDLELIEGMTKDSLLAMKEDLDEYMEEIESGKEIEDKKKESRTFIGDIWGAFRENYGRGEKKKGTKVKKKKKRSRRSRLSLFRGMNEETFRNYVANGIADNTFTIYDTYKKAYGLFSL
jgi:hypothetical protein